MPTTTVSTRRPRTTLGLCGLVVLLLVTALPSTPGSSTAGAAELAAPNIVVVLTDDQRWDTLWAMPAVQRELVGRGVTFTDAFVVNPLCCPSRASILKGQYSRSTGVYKNKQFAAFDDSWTIATRLDEVGYRTGLIGKYLIGYYDDRLASYVPPGWDRWFALMDPKYYDYGVSDDGVLRSFGSAPADYNTDVLANEAVGFIESTPTDTPLFLYFAPIAPHEPATAADRHEGAFRGIEPHRPPSYNEEDVSDKPAHIQALSTRGSPDKLRRKQYESLLAVDEAVDRLVQALTTTGRIENTMIVFVSDHGFLWKEHRWKGKTVPYEESIRIPFVLRYDALVPEPRTDDRLVLNIDLAPTFADVAAGSTAGMDGDSLLGLLASPQTATWRADFIVEHVLFQRVPAYCAVRNRDAIYVRYATEEEELYDLVADPYQLDNRASDPAYAELRDQMHARLVQLCSPPPPGLDL